MNWLPGLAPADRLRTAGSRVGRRGAFLLFLATVDGYYASVLAAPTARTRTSPTLVFIAHTAPLWAWAVLWSTVGVLCVVGAFTRQDRVAFAAAAGLKALAGLMLILAQIVDHVQRAYVGGLVWLAFAAVTYLISTWPEPPAARRAR